MSQFRGRILRRVHSKDASPELRHSLRLSIESLPSGDHIGSKRWLGGGAECRMDPRWLLGPTELAL